jgi:GntR family transcriptional repressor for pyruvate dehydrogenase complex
LNFKQIKPMKIYEEVAEQLKEAIISGKYQPGDKLPSVRELGEQLNIGRPAVREAFTALKAMGLVEIRQGEGTFVAKYNSEDLKSKIRHYGLLAQKDVERLYEVRRILELGSANLAAQHRTEVELQRMRDALMMMEDSIASGNVEQYDWKFHLAIAEATQNPVLVQLMDSISQSTKQILSNAREALFEIGYEKLLHQHAAILDAIEAKDSIRAQEMMLQHLNYVENKLFSEL